MGLVGDVALGDVNGARDSHATGETSMGTPADGEAPSVVGGLLAGEACPTLNPDGCGGAATKEALDATETPVKILP